MQYVLTNGNNGNKPEILPLVSTYCNNYSNRTTVRQANFLLRNCPDKETKKRFDNKQVILATRQPPNLLRQLTSAKFDTKPISSNEKGIYKCENNNCKICRLYLMECKSFKTSNGTTWEIPTRITCHSKKVIYYQICTSCNVTTNIGKTNNLRLRTNGHISSCRLGNSSDKFDNHVFACNKEKEEPFFKLAVFMEVNDIDKLLVYEHYLQKCGHDTLNNTAAKTRK